MMMMMRGAGGGGDEGFFCFFFFSLTDQNITTSKIKNNRHLRLHEVRLRGALRPLGRGRSLVPLLAQPPRRRLPGVLALAARRRRRAQGLLVEVPRAAAHVHRVRRRAPARVPRREAAALRLARRPEALGDLPAVDGRRRLAGFSGAARGTQRHRRLLPCGDLVLDARLLSDRRQQVGGQDGDAAVWC